MTNMKNLKIKTQFFEHIIIARRKCLFFYEQIKIYIFWRNNIFFFNFFYISVNKVT